MEFWNWLSGVLAGLGQILASEKSPWWGIPLITGLATLFGALVAFISTRASDRRKARHEDNRRYDEEIKKICAKFLSHNDEYKKKSQEYTQLKQAKDERSIVDPQTGITMTLSAIAYRDSDTYYKKASKSLDKLSFVAPESLQAACRAIFMIAVEIDMFDKDDKEINDRYTQRRWAVLNELRKTIKLRPLPYRGTLWMKVKGRIRNPKLLLNDFETYKKNRRKKKSNTAAKAD